MAKNTFSGSLVLLGIAFCTVALSSAQGQYTYSQIESGSGAVWSVSVTELDFEGDYYGAFVYAELFDPYGNLLDSGSDQEDESFSAEVDLYADANESGYYYVEGSHWGFDLGGDDWEPIGVSYDGTYAYPPGGGPPTISGIYPQSGAYGAGDGWGAGNGYIEVFGSNFDPEDCGCLAWASFGVLWVSDTQVNLYYPDSTPVGNYQVALETEMGMYSNAVTFAVTGDSTPWISSISPATWTAGTTVPVNIYGSGFGTSPTLMISCCGIDSYPLTYVSDGLITANVTIDPGAPTENVTLWVVSNGYYGFGFQGQSGGSNQSQPSQAYVQSCSTPALYVTSNGNQISQGQTVYVGPAPQMPAISAYLAPVVPCILTGTASFQLSTSYNGGSSAYPYGPPAQQPASQAFNVPTSPFYGGQATITWTYNGSLEPSFTFNILGQNPPTAAVQASLSGWAVNIGIHESALKQFDGNGIPIQNPRSPPGYGVMQLTVPVPTEDQKWNWQSNVVAGQAYVATELSSGLSWFQSQVGQWNLWNSDSANPQVGPAQDYWEGACTFSMKGTGNCTYDQAIGLKQYAGAPLPWGNFLYWNNKQGGTPSWTVSAYNGLTPDIVYEFVNCTSVTSCAHSGTGHSLGN